ncbi:trigger factor [Parasphaerochaeta coccoides]|uniref:Trigger factor n=1 Tax=Parasphaerochaeta coccoides (strain ATCC BAA-1237 / DSM 17374 / SPN1) TaxID=760011 RepID=F4GHB8_PARC1|nr:trigger factor [Parasphaerochaeta coccoides]AEC02017.1 Trigger factor [Parasphaerochaeta coccoides DSM 17374]
MSAEKKIKELGNSSVELTLTITAADIEAAYKELLATYGKKAQIKGFRTGKAPLSVLEGKFGQAIREESTFNTLEKTVQAAVAEIEDQFKPLPYSTPVLQNEESLLPFKPDTDITFSVVYDVIPAFELPAYKGLTVEAPKVEVTDDLVNKEIEQLRDQNALVREKDGTVANGDVVTVDYTELDADKNEIENTARKDFTFTVGSGYNFYKIDEDIIGMAKDEEKIFEKTYPADYDLPDYAGKTIALKATVKNVKTRELPELDDEFAQDVKEEYKTVADLVKATREKLEEHLKTHLDETKLSALTDKILETVDIPVPASMIRIEVEQNWNKFVRQSGLNEEQVLKFLQFQNQTKESVMDEWKEPAAKSLKVQLLLDKIKEAENFQIDDKELAEAEAEQLKDITDEAQKTYYRDMILDDLKFRKVGPFLLENNTFIEGEPLTYDQFIQGAHATHAH